MEGSNVNRILSFLSCFIFVVGSGTYFFYYEDLDIIFPQFIFYINYGSVYLFSLSILLMSKYLLVKTASIMSASIALGKVFYNLTIHNLDILEERRMLFLISCIVFMIVHTVIWLGLEINKKWKS